tara:strand:- start:265 stop:666 length:402 start_codon:yes stop_codon:yes gene_type:complete
MSDFTENVGKCPQLVIYLTFSLMSIIASLITTNNMYNETNTKGKDVNMFNHLVMTIIISGLFYYLCAYDYGSLAWILLLFPLIILSLLFIFVYGIFSSISKVSIDEKDTETERKRVNNESFKGYQGATTYTKF